MGWRKGGLWAVLFALGVLIARSLGASWEAIVWGVLACLAGTAVEWLVTGGLFRLERRPPPDADRLG